MASPPVVKRCLKAFANNYGKTDSWIEDTLRLWSRGLNNVNDRDLVRGTETWCRSKRTPPNLARLLELIEADPKKAGPLIAQGCPGCDQTGWRELVRHFIDANDRPQVYPCMAACDCAMGQRIAVGPVPIWSTTVEAWRANPMTTAIYYGTAQQPHLTTEQRMTAAQYETFEQLKGQPVASKTWAKATTNRGT
tara:strand:+ start:2333 stop:2911 length:579 start_codon:yes stop_codon:yes gene_type:complete